ncbi:signal peptidase II [Cellulomonas soli]
MPSPAPSSSPVDPVEEPTTPLVDPAAPTPGEPDVPPVAGRRRRRLLLTFGLLTVVVLAADQVTKAWALSALEPGTRTPVLGDLFGLQLIRNSGAALSMANGMTWVLTLVACVVVVVVIRASRRLGSAGWALAFGLLLGGALGNLVDRFWRSRASPAVTWWTSSPTATGSSGTSPTSPSWRRRGW